MATSGAFTDYTENAVLNHILGATTFAKPSGRFLALYTTAPTDSSVVGEVSTVTWTNYARAPITFSAASNGSITNNVTVDFGVVAGTGATITHWGIFDAATGGNMLIRGDFGIGQTASAGNAVTVPNGTLTVTLD